MATTRTSARVTQKATPPHLFEREQGRESARHGKLKRQVDAPSEIQQPDVSTDPSCRSLLVLDELSRSRSLLCNRRGGCRDLLLFGIGRFDVLDDLYALIAVVLRVVLQKIRIDSVGEELLRRTAVRDCTVVETDNEGRTGSAELDVVADEDDRTACHERTLEALVVDVLGGVGVNGSEDVVKKDQGRSRVNGSLKRRGRERELVRPRSKNERQRKDAPPS